MAMLKKYPVILYVLLLLIGYGVGVITAPVVHRNWPARSGLTSGAPNMPHLQVRALSTCRATSTTRAFTRGVV